MCEGFPKEIYSHVSDKQRQCIIMIDEIYAMRFFPFHGSSIFGRAAHNSNFKRTRKCNFRNYEQMLAW